MSVVDPKGGVANEGKTCNSQIMPILLSLASLLLNTILLNNIVKYVHKMMLKKKYVLFMYIKINKIDSFWIKAYESIKKYAYESVFQTIFFYNLVQITKENCLFILNGL